MDVVDRSFGAPLYMQVVVLLLLLGAGVVPSLPAVDALSGEVATRGPEAPSAGGSPAPGDLRAHPVPDGGSTPSGPSEDVTRDPEPPRAAPPPPPEAPHADDLAAEDPVHAGENVSDRLPQLPDRAKDHCLRTGDGCEQASDSEAAPGRRATRSAHTYRPIVLASEQHAWAFAGIAASAGLAAAIAWRVGGLGSWALQARVWLGLGWRVDAEALKRHPARGRMLEHLRTDPGATSQELATVAGVGYNRAVYHIGMLERGGLVRIHRRGRRKRYYLADAPRVAPEDLLLHDLTDPASKSGKILALLQYAPGLSLTMVARRLDLSPGHAHYHLTRLSSTGLVDRVRRGRRIRHYLTDHGHAKAPSAAASGIPLRSEGVTA